MVFERTENEPEERDPEAEFRDPESDSLTIPRVDTEDAGSGIRSELREDLAHDDADTSDRSAELEDVPSELLKTFWAVALVVNAAVLAVALGIMFLLFEGNLSQGGLLVVGGVVLLGFAVRRYRRYQGSSENTDGDGSNEKSTTNGDGSNEKATADGDA